MTSLSDACSLLSHPIFFLISSPLLSILFPLYLISLFSRLRSCNLSSPLLSNTATRTATGGLQLHADASDALKCASLANESLMCTPELWALWFNNQLRGRFTASCTSSSTVRELLHLPPGLPSAESRRIAANAGTGIASLQRKVHPQWFEEESCAERGGRGWNICRERRTKQRT